MRQPSDRSQIPLRDVRAEREVPRPLVRVMGPQINQRPVLNDDVDLVMQSSSVGPRSSAARPEPRAATTLDDYGPVQISAQVELPLSSIYQPPKTPEEEYVPLQDVNLTIRNAIKDAGDEEGSDGAHNKSYSNLWSKPAKEMTGSLNFNKWLKAQNGFHLGSKNGIMLNNSNESTDYDDMYKRDASNFPKFKSHIALNCTVTFINFDPSKILNLGQQIKLSQIDEEEDEGQINSSTPHRTIDSLINGRGICDIDP